MGFRIIYLISKVVEGKYPNFKQVIKDDFNQAVVEEHVRWRNGTSMDDKVTLRIKTNEMEICGQST